MKFRNVSGDTLDVPALGLSVADGETTPDLDRKTAAGFIGNTELWSAVGGPAKKAQKRAAEKAVPAPDAPINTEETP